MHIREPSPGSFCRQEGGLGNSSGRYALEMGTGTGAPGLQYLRDPPTSRYVDEETGSGRGDLAWVINDALQS